MLPRIALKRSGFNQLKVLNLENNTLGDKSVVALASHPVANQLRILRLGANMFGKTGLTAIARHGAFTELTTLDLKSYHKKKVTPAEMVMFASALHLPRLRHLDLQGWPLGDEGAKALATNPALAELTRLDLSRCDIGEAGAKALFSSPYLQNLVELHLGYNDIETGGQALADPAVMPRLGECWLSSKSAAKIERDGLYLIT